jgi:beta-lactamase regulating signal transducer with metallopeptidase domain/sporulation protein YlmC with PRC-barrel domain
MNALAHILAPELLRTLGLALLHFLWQGAALGAIGAAALALARTASARYAIGIAALVLMVIAPATTFVVLRNSASAVPAATHRVAGAVPIARIATPVPSAVIPGRETGFLTSSTLTWVVQLWFAGVMLFSLRTAGGLFLVARLRRRDAKPIVGELLARCNELQDRLGITRAIRYCESVHLDVPAVIGWFKPVVLLPLSALTGLSEAQLRTVIAHELTHIRRFDAFFNLFEVAAETLLFYHPAVWWLNKRIRAERENCCDDAALALCGNPADYARALALMEEWRDAPSFAMAANRGPLATRVARLLGIGEERNDLGSAGVVFGVLCLATTLLAGNTLFGIVRTASAQGSNPQPVLQHAVSKPGPVITVTAPRLTPHYSPEQKTDPQEKVSKKSGSFLEGLKAEGFENLTADQLIALKVQDVTPEYIHAMRTEGLNPDVDQLIGMKTQGIGPEYVRQIRALNLKADADSLIGMKVQGITPEYVAEMRKLGFQPDTDQLIGMKVQGITPQYVEEMRKLGFQPDADQIVGMKVQGITAEYVHSLNELGIHPDADDLIGMKVQGIEPDFIRSIRATGLAPDKDEWIALKVQGVDAEYVKGLQAAGFKPDVEEVVSAKVMGVTPAFIELARNHGFKNLDLRKLALLKQTGVLE